MGPPQQPNLTLWIFSGQTPEGGSARGDLPEALQPYVPAVGAKMDISVDADEDGPFVKMVPGEGWGAGTAPIFRNLKFRPVDGRGVRVRAEGPVAVSDDWTIDGVDAVLDDPVAGKHAFTATARWSKGPTVVLQEWPCERPD
jgi:hypothetical protein